MARKVRAPKHIWFDAGVTRIYTEDDVPVGVNSESEGAP